MICSLDQITIEAPDLAAARAQYAGSLTPRDSSDRLALGQGAPNGACSSARAE